MSFEGFVSSELDAEPVSYRAPAPGFLTAKRVFDVVVSLALLPVLAAVMVVLIVANPFLNAGPLIFTQMRMGRDCRPFRTYKFRSMTAIGATVRGANDPLEADRITRLGRVLRRTRIDELPQILNVLRGEMSLIGPRPDSYDHAIEFVRLVPGYAARHSVLPGISGLAQTTLGYAEGIEATRRKVASDLDYIRNSGFGLEFYVVWRTFVTVLSQAGK